MPLTLRSSGILGRIIALGTRYWTELLTIVCTALLICIDCGIFDSSNMNLGPPGYVLSGFEQISSRAASARNELLEARTTFKHRVVDRGSIPKESLAKDVIQINLLELRYLSYAWSIQPLLTGLLELLESSAGKAAILDLTTTDAAAIDQAKHGIFESLKAWGECNTALAKNSDVLSNRLMSADTYDVDAEIALLNGLTNTLSNAPDGAFSKCDRAIIDLSTYAGTLAQRYPDVQKRAEQRAEVRSLGTKLGRYPLILILMACSAVGTRRWIKTISKLFGA